MRRSSFNDRDKFASTVVVLVSAFLLYAATLSRHYTGDSIEFARAFENVDWPKMLETHQILMHPIGWGFYKLWQAFGWNGGSLLPSQVLNAIAGASSVALIYLAVDHLTRSSGQALLVALCSAFSAGMWLFSTEAEFVTIPLAVTLYVLLQFLRLSGPESVGSTKVAIQTGLGVGLAILIYLSSVLLIPVGIAAACLAHSKSMNERIHWIGSFLAAIAVIVLPAYVLTFYFVHGVQDWSALITVSPYRGANQLYGGWPTLQSAIEGSYAMARTFFVFPGIGLNDRTSTWLRTSSVLGRIGFFAYCGIMLVALGFLFQIVWRRRRAFLVPYRRELAILATWLLTYAAFALYWAPGDLQFWLPVNAGMWLAASVVLSRLNSDKHASLRRSRSKLALAGFVSVLLLCVNGAGLILPHRSLETNEAYWIAQTLKAKTNTKDLIVTSGGDRFYPYVSYFTGRHTVSVLEGLLGSQYDKQGAFNRLDAEIARARSSGGRVYLIGLDPGVDVWWDALAKAGLEREDFRRFQTMPSWSFKRETILEVSFP